MERGYEAVGFLHLRHVLAALRSPDASKPLLIILELFNLPVHGKELEALASCGIPTVVLGGAVVLNEEIVQKHRWAALMKRPFTLGDVADLVKKITPVPNPSPPSEPSS
jgi:hypothetical protein